MVSIPLVLILALSGVISNSVCRPLDVPAGRAAATVAPTGSIHPCGIAAGTLLQYSAAMSSNSSSSSSSVACGPDGCVIHEPPDESPPVDSSSVAAAEEGSSGSRSSSSKDSQIAPSFSPRSWFTSFSRSRHSWPSLQQSDLCTAGCDPAWCVQDSAGIGAEARCLRCLGNLLLKKTSGKCGCPAGRFSPSANACADCPKGYICPGGDYAADEVAILPAKQSCPTNMTTNGRRSTKIVACVNLPGFSYTIDAAGTTVAAVPCPVNTYCGGLRKQRACVPCPTGFQTDGQEACTSASACVLPPVPAGYYIEPSGCLPGRNILPCPVGEWSPGIAAPGLGSSWLQPYNCSKCAPGVSTQTVASTSADACTVLLPGYYATEVWASGAITATAACPQKYYCPGGVATPTSNVSNGTVAVGSDLAPQPCPSGLWTQQPGSTSQYQCLTPPGHYTSSNGTQICPDASFRGRWVPANQAASCTSCGPGVKGEKWDTITVYDPATGEASLLPVMSNYSSCYIERGQGLYFASSTGTFRARNCDDGGSYGARKRMYGLVAYPCRACPSGMITSSNATSNPNSAAWFVDNGDGTKGFYDIKGCVTQPGCGFTGYYAPPCSQGSYNPGDTYSNCTRCPTGLTTQGVGKGITLSDCGLAAGYGYNVASGNIMPCPKGTYNDVAWSANTTTPCTACPPGTTTTREGATSLSACVPNESPQLRRNTPLVRKQS